MAGDELRIEPMTEADGPAVLEIYGQGIATGVATFETVVPEWRAWNASHRRDCRFVARLDGRLVGWTAVARYSSRDVYAGVAWESIYVDAAARGRGVGAALLAALIPASEASGIWTLIAGVQERIGRDATGVWRDVVLLERRSPIVGE